MYLASLFCQNFALWDVSAADSLDPDYRKDAGVVPVELSIPPGRMFRVAPENLLSLLNVRDLRGSKSLFLNKVLW